MQFFFRNCTHILTRTQGEKFEDMFLVKIASKGTSLTRLQPAWSSLRKVLLSIIVLGTQAMSTGHCTIQLAV